MKSKKVENARLDELAAAQKAGDRTREAIALESLGEFYRSKRKLDLSIAYLKQVLAIYRETEDEQKSCRQAVVDGKVKEADSA